MRNYRILVLLALITLSSCSGSKKAFSTTVLTNPAKETTTNENLNSSENENVDSQEVMSTKKEGMVEEGSDMTSKAKGDTEPANNVQIKSGSSTSSEELTQMFGELEMNEDQIRSYKSAMKAFEERKRTKPNAEMLGSLESERTRQLEKILSTSQLEKYKEWQTANN